MKRAIIFFIIAIITLCSFSSQLLALPEGAVARLGKGTVNAVAFSPDGKILAIASSIGVWFYDAKTFAEIGLLETNAWITSVAFSSDGSLLASGSSDSTIKLWDVKSGSLIRTLEGHIYSVLSVAFSPDGNLLSSGSADRTIILWDMTPYIQEPATYPCDVNSDGIVNILDLVIISKNFGKSAPNNAKADVNKDGVVDILDLNIVGQHFGQVY